MYKNMIEDARESILKDIETLVKIPSVRDLTTKEEGMPFGLGINDALLSFSKIAENLGFTVTNHEGYAVSAQLGSQEEHIGILAHIDVVEANETDWDSEPFSLSIRDDIMYGRGVNDDKGPLIGALYAAKFAYESTKDPHYAVRVIVGGAEETTWECMTHYFKHNPQPVFGFSPDGNFPIVNGEMGVLQLALQFDEKPEVSFTSSPRVNFCCHELYVEGVLYTGDKNLSRNPQRGENAIDNYLKQEKAPDSKLMTFIQANLQQDYKGTKLEIALEHYAMNDLSVSMMSLNTNENGYELCIDIRYPINTNEEKLLTHFETLSYEYGFSFEKIKGMRPLFVDEKSPLIEILKASYQEVMQEKAQVLTKGGASYARVLNRGVAFGATFEGEDPRPHMTNEKMPVASLLKASEIYAVSIEKLITNNYKLPQ